MDDTKLATALSDLHAARVAEFAERPFIEALARNASAGSLGERGRSAALLTLKRYGRSLDASGGSEEASAALSVRTEGERFLLDSPFRLKDLCKRVQGARWDSGHKAWTYTASPTSAQNLVAAFADHQLTGDERFNDLLSESVRREDAQGLKDATDLDPIPFTKGTPWLHQLQAYHFAQQLPSAMLALDMGTGKSRIAVDLITNASTKKTDAGEPFRVLVICPKSVIGVWPRELGLHAGLPWTTCAPLKGTVAKRTEEAKVAYDSPNERVAIIVNYEAARAAAFQTWSTKVDWDYVIFDESHRIKDGQSKTSRYCSKLTRKSDRRLMLTGTPLPNGPLDIFGQYRTLDPDIFGRSFTAFRARYALMGGYGGYEVLGYQNEDEFNKKLYSIAFRVSSDDVLDLPGEHDVTRTCVLEPKAQKIYDALEDEMIAQINDGVVTAANALVKLLRLQQVTGGALHDDDKNLTYVSTAKAELLADIATDLPADEPIVVFCQFVHDLDVVKGVAEKLKRSYGEVSGRRNDMGADAKMPAGIDIMAVQVASGSEGIDLTRSHVAIFYSLGFSLAQYLQARRRLSRPGQTRKVLFLHLEAEKTIDGAIYAALDDKQEVVDYVLTKLEHSK